MCASAHELFACVNTLHMLGKILGSPVMLMRHKLTRDMLRGCSGLYPGLFSDSVKRLTCVSASAGEGKMFSPGNLRATFDNPNYERLISHYIGEKYTLRYTGGMVPDVFQVTRISL